MLYIVTDARIKKNTVFDKKNGCKLNFLSIHKK